MKSIKYPVCTLLSAMLLLTFCGRRENTGETIIEARTPVTITTPRIKDVSVKVEFPALTTYLIKNIVRASSAGIVESVAVIPGQKIRNGELLFTIKTREAAALQASSKADTTLGFRGIINVPSPKDGVVSSISRHTGDFVQEGDDLAVISDEGSLVFVLEVPFEMTQYIMKGKGCTLRLPDNTTMMGKIGDKLPEMNVQDQTVNYIILPESKRYLPQNLMAFAGIVKETRKNSLVLPRNAVLGNETQTEFWIMKLINDSVAVRLPVKKGFEDLNEVEITEPELMPDDRILLTGNYGLPDTAAVRIQN